MVTKAAPTTVQPSGTIPGLVAQSIKACYMYMELDDFVFNRKSIRYDIVDRAGLPQDILDNVCDYEMYEDDFPDELDAFTTLQIEGEQPCFFGFEKGELIYVYVHGVSYRQINDELIELPEPYTYHEDEADTEEPGEPTVDL